MGQNRNTNQFLRYKLRDAAKDGRVVICRCTGCRRTIHYLASDLCEVLSGDLDALYAPFPCSKCKTRDYIFVSLRLPAAGDYGHLLIRRPGPVKVTQTWRTVRLGD